MTGSTPCPDSGMLLRYWTGRVPEPHATVIRQHLAGCSSCAELLATAGEAPDESATFAARGSVSRPTPFRSASAAASLTPSGRLTFDFLERPSRAGIDNATPMPPEGGLTSTGGSGVRPGGSGIRPAAGSGVRPAAYFPAGSDAVPEIALTAARDLPAGHGLERSSPLDGATLPSMMYLGQCPNCADMLRDLGGTGWCLRCGYTTGVGHAFEQSGRTQVSLLWMIPALAGCGGVIAATAFRYQFLPPGSFFQVWWIGLEALIGILLYLIAHLWIIAVTFRQWPEGELFKFIDPMTVLRYGFAHMSRTRPALCLALWGATAFLCAFVLFWMNDFAFKDKSKRKPPQPAPISQGSGFQPQSPEEEEAEDYTPPGGTALADPADPTDSDVALIDLSGNSEPDRQPPPPRTTECVVIGYIPDPNDPNKIGQLILGTRSEDGSIRFAGVVKHFAKVEGVDRGLAEVRTARPLVNPPNYLPSDLAGAIPLEPSLTCRVNFGERDANGIYRNTVLQGVTSPKENPVPKN